MSKEHVGKIYKHVYDEDIIKINGWNGFKYDCAILEDPKKRWINKNNNDTVIIFPNFLTDFYTLYYVYKSPLYKAVNHA